MLIRPLSDIHVEFWRYEQIDQILNQVIPPLDTDKETICILAGDIGLIKLPKTWVYPIELLSSRFKKVICVSGNHFFYDSNNFDNFIDIIDMYKLPQNVFFLENNSIEIDDVVFIAANLWTDFNKENPFEILAAKQHMNDFIKIRKSNNKILEPQDTIVEFYKSKEYIFETIKKNISKKIVVITHHGCTELSIPHVYNNSNFNYAYTNNLLNEIFLFQPLLWIHGHTHHSFDYKLKNTRIVVNPYGYRKYQENKEYIKDLVIEI